MADEKVTNRDLIKLRRSVALRELALAVSYPQTHSGITMHGKRTDGAIPVAPEMGWPASSVRPNGMELHDIVSQRLADRRQASALTATIVATPVVEPRQGRVRDNPDPPVSVAKPWKKPWDK
jgi:hypothetical protein